MKLESITLENFGVFGRKKLDFAAAPLVLVYGANEAGKTTALNGIRQAILGFKVRTPYLTGSQMTAEVTGVLQDGSPIEFQRRKGRPDTVSGTAYGKQLSEQDLQSILGNLDLQSYEYLLGFSQEELRKGQETLKSAKLSEALAGGSLGGIHRLETLRSELSETIGELYKPRGSTSSINALLSQINAARDTLKSCEVLPSVIEQWRSQLSEMEQQAELTKSKRGQLFRHKRLTERLLEALPAYRARCQLVQQLQALEVPNDLSIEQLRECRQLIEEQHRLRNALESEVTKLSSDRAAVQALEDNVELLHWEDQIESLGHQADGIPRLRDEQAALEEEAREADDRLSTLLQDLHLDSLPPQLENIKISALQRQRLEEWVSSMASAEQQLLTLNGKLDAAEQVLKQNSLEASPTPDNLHDLSDLVTQLAKLEAELVLLSKDLASRQQDHEHLQRGNSLARYLEPQAAVDRQWHLPHPGQVEEYAERWDTLSKTEAKHLSLLKQREEELGAILEENKRQQIPEAEELSENLAQLAETRNGILRHWLDELSEPLLAASIGREEQQERIRELQRIALKQDRSQQELLEIADIVAAAKQRQHRINRLQEHRDQARQLLQETEKQSASLRQEWQACWSHLPILPASPSKMQAWMADFSAWCQEERRQHQAQEQIRALEEQVNELRGQLAQLWPTKLRQGSSIQILQKRIEEWEKSRHEQEANLRRQKEAQISIELLKRDIENLRGVTREIQAAYIRWLKDSGLQAIVQDMWPLKTALRLLDILDSLRREQKTIERSKRQLEQSSQRLREFEDSVAELARAMQYNVEPAMSDVHARQWLNAVREARQAKSQRIELSARVKHHESHCQSLREQLKAIEKAIESAAAKGGPEAIAEAQMLIDKFRHQEELQASLAEKNAALATLASDPTIRDWLATDTGPDETESSIGEIAQAMPIKSDYVSESEPQQIPVSTTVDTLEQLCSRLATLDQTSLEMAVEDATKQMALIDTESRQIDQEIGSLKERIAHTAQNRLAQETRQKLQDLRGELVELTEQWVVASLAQDLLTRSIDLFAKENEPRLLQLAREYLKQLTAGRYANLEHDSSHKEMFVVRNQKDQKIPLEKLSTGTREQLYLAIRMAFITQYFTEHEPLPVVMDDCFVNFDDRRTRLALESISGWAPNIQTILLSCHSRVPKILSEIAPETRVIDLHGEVSYRAGDFNSSLSHAEHAIS